MRFSLLPSLLIRSVTDLTPELLEQRGIRLLMLDFDNTIVPYTTDQPTPEMEYWLKQLAASPIALCVVSNSKRERVPAFCRRYDLPYITHAKKPFSRGIRACLAQFHLPPEQCALAGDQIFTDTLGANCAGIRPILVQAIDNHNIWLKLRHVAEMPFILLSNKRRLNDEKH